MSSTGSSCSDGAAAENVIQQRGKDTNLLKERRDEGEAGKSSLDVCLECVR